MTLIPAESFIAPVAGHTDLIQFQYDFVLEGKSLGSVVTEEENGDLIIEGYAAVFEGIDRQGENFMPGAFQRGIKSFLGAQSALCFHHKRDQVLGKVLDLHEEEGKGLKMRARVDGAIRSHPVLGTYYQQIKSGTLNGLSVGGFFKRAMTPEGPRICETDFTEISVTGVPMHTGPRFEVVAGKALASDLTSRENVSVTGLPEEEIRDEDFESIQYAIDTLDSVFRRIGRRGSEDPKENTTPAVAVGD